MLGDIDAWITQADMTLREWVRRPVYASLASRHASTDQVPARLGMSRRTLHTGSLLEGLLSTNSFDLSAVDGGPEWGTLTHSHRPG